jgi:fused signal recognition particle receptor
LRRLRSGLAKTRSQLAAGVGNLLLGKKEIDETILEDLETSLLRADVGVAATTRIMDSLTQRVRRKQLNDTTALHEALRQELLALLVPITGTFSVDVERRPFVVLVVESTGLAIDTSANSRNV